MLDPLVKISYTENHVDECDHILPLHAQHDAIPASGQTLGAASCVIAVSSLAQSKPSVRTPGRRFLFYIVQGVVTE
jgi:hypothetical protein